MEPLQFLRLLQRRWLTVVVLASIGATLGFASSRLQPAPVDTPVVTYWTASEVLILNDQGRADLNLPRVAPFVTGETLLSRAAATLGVDTDDLSPTIRTVTDTTAGTLEISVVATSPDAAAAAAAAVADALQQRLADDRQAEFNVAVSAASTELFERLRERNALDAQIAAATDPESESPPTEDELADLHAEHDAAVVRAVNAEDALDLIERGGVAPAQLVDLDTVTPLQITEGEYRSRIAKGRQGDTDFTSAEVGLARTATAATRDLDTPLTRALAGGLTGLLLALLAITVQLRFDPRLRSATDADRAFGYGVLATVPKLSRKDRRRHVLHALHQPRSTVAEAHRYLRSALLYAKANTAPVPDAGDERASREVRVVMVTSPGAGEGKTTTAANLAVTFAEAGYETLLVNCDHRLPAAHEMLGLDYLPGKIHHTAIAHLRFIADVERNEHQSPEQITERQRAIIGQARELVDVVILDTAPILATNDAVDLLPDTDLVVMVCREGKTTRAAADDTRDLLDRMGVPVAGLVVTCAGSVMGSGYFERYRYGSYYRLSERKAARRPGQTSGTAEGPVCLPLEPADLVDWIPDPLDAMADSTEPFHAAGRRSGEVVDLTSISGRG